MAGVWDAAEERMRSFEERAREAAPAQVYVGEQRIGVDLPVTLQPGAGDEAVQKAPVTAVLAAISAVETEIEVALGLLHKRLGPVLGVSDVKSVTEPTGAPNAPRQVASPLVEALTGHVADLDEILRMIHFITARLEV